ncbi:MAG: 16S rRNA (uracil(1498)-N(3))-methyltransferase [Clostridium sp.]|nr:16S rRNA (uracil(1498)-N(3))-methyltransferase [Clostridium sp.]
MSRFFVDGENIFADSIIIEGNDVNHIKKVLRLKRNDKITIADGKGTDYEVKITEIEKASITTSILNTKRNAAEPPIDITLFQGVPKSEKMDFVIQKSVELGVGSIIPLTTERTIVKLTEEKEVQKKLRRWNRISMEAAKQSGRGVIPVVKQPTDFKSALNTLKNSSLSVIPYEGERENGLRKIIPSGFSAGEIFIFIGSEGGFTKQEIESAVNYGVHPVTLGPRILRTETAGIVALSILMYEIGDVGG